jgi:hypothetical protein
LREQKVLAMADYILAFPNAKTFYHYVLITCV